MKTANNTAAKAAKKSTTAKAVKHETAKATLSMKELAEQQVSNYIANNQTASSFSPTERAELVEQICAAIRKDSKATAKSGKTQPTAEDIAAKQHKAAISRRDKVTNAIVESTFKKVLSVPEWLKAAKAEAANVDPQFAKQIENKWATLCVELKKADSYYSVVTTKTVKGVKKSLISYIPVEWKTNDKVVIPCRKDFTPTEYRFNSDCKAVSISKADELVIKHKVLENHPIVKTIDGAEYKRDNFVEVEKTFRPVELTEFTPSQFKKRFKLAMQAVFPDGFAVESK